LATSLIHTRSFTVCDAKERIQDMRVKNLTGSTADFHARTVPEGLTEAEAWVFAPADRSLVLGSAQQESIADSDAAARAGVEVAKRRSGGGAVYVDPDRCLWVDVVVPRHDERWSDDVREATYWLGELWQRALATIGLDTRLYRDGLEQTPWGRLVCFAALGPGEVLVGDRKVVGISQRRTREGARFQCIAYDRWDAADVLDLLDLSLPDRAAAAADLAERATGVGEHLEKLRAAVIDELRAV
jgi:lipoate-protein ligase A